MSLFRIFKKQSEPEKEEPQRYIQTQAEVPDRLKVCPYCQKDLSKRKTPTRRSQFTCPGCSEKVYAEPRQPIYPSPFLTEIQASYVKYLWQLDHWVFTMGSNAEYLRTKAALSARFGSEAKPGDVIWALMNESMLKTCQDQFECGMLKKLMGDFRKFTKAQERR